MMAITVAPAGRGHEQGPSPFRYFHSPPEIIRMAALLYVRFPLSLRNGEDLLFERGIDETQHHWWNRFGPMSPRIFAGSECPGCAAFATGAGTSASDTSTSSGDECASD